MFSRTTRHSLLSLLILASTSSAQFPIYSLSFGLTPELSPNGVTIPGWHLGGEGHDPYLMSDRIVLTPPAPGNKRGGLWTEHSIQQSEWSVDVEFRASGPERGSGNMQVWFAKDTAPMSAFRSIYTVDRFDGLVLQIDQYGGQGGSVRGFLSDGSLSYKNYQSVDGLAFGHCNYAYRNLGRWSKLTIKSTAEGFSVLIDDKTCFSSSDIQLPKGYYFGISAASAETPDSFEISKFAVSASDRISREQPRARPRQPAAEEMARPADEPTTGSKAPPFTSHPSSGGQAPVENSAQLSQMLALLQSLTLTVADLKTEVDIIKTKLDSQTSELKSAVMDVPTHFPFESLSEVSRKTNTIESTVLQIRRDVEGRDYKEHLTGLQAALQDTRESLLSGLPVSVSKIVTTSAPSLWLAIFVLIAFQALLAASYVVYKKRRANSPKKLL